MIIGIEHLKPLEQMASKQTRIYRDAADIGLWKNSQNAPLIRSCLDGLKESYRGLARTSGKSRTWMTFVPYEMAEGDFVGVLIEVSLCEVAGSDLFDQAQRRNSFYVIYLFNCRWEEAKKRMGQRASKWTGPFKDLPQTPSVCSQCSESYQPGQKDDGFCSDSCLALHDQQLSGTGMAAGLFNERSNPEDRSSRSALAELGDELETEPACAAGRFVNLEEEQPDEVLST